MRHYFLQFPVLFLYKHSHDCRFHRTFFIKEIFHVVSYVPLRYKKINSLSSVPVYYPADEFCQNIKKPSHMILNINKMYDKRSRTKVIRGKLVLTIKRIVERLLSATRRHFKNEQITRHVKIRPSHISC